MVHWFWNCGFEESLIDKCPANEAWLAISSRERLARFGSHVQSTSVK